MPANCSGCDSNLGSPYDDTATGQPIKWFFTPEDRALFSIPAAGEFGNVGRNAFTGPGQVYINLNASKRFFMPWTHTLEFRADITNLTNTVSFGFPTATYTSTTFGRILRSTIAWYNEHRAHSALDGRTPLEVHRTLPPANERARFEPRRDGPRKSRCAAPAAPIKRRRGARLELAVHHIDGRRLLPAVELKRADVTRGEVDRPRADRARQSPVYALNPA